MCIRDSNYSASLIALNASSGSIHFAQRMIHNDVWDYDGVGQPIIIQNFYDNNGNHLAHLDLAFGLINTDTRKLTSMPKASFEIFKNCSKSDSFKILTKEDMRKHGKFPKNYINEQ